MIIPEHEKSESTRHTTRSSSDASGALQVLLLIVRPLLLVTKDMAVRPALGGSQFLPAPCRIPAPLQLPAQTSHYAVMILSNARLMASSAARNISTLGSQSVSPSYRIRRIMGYGGPKIPQRAQKGENMAWLDFALEFKYVSTSSASRGSARIRI